MSCTSPPPARVAVAWPSSCSALMTGKTKASSSRLSACSTRSDRLSVRSGQCAGSSASAGSTISSHQAIPVRLQSARHNGTWRSRKRPGSSSGMRSAIGFTQERRRFCAVSRSPLVNSSSASGGTSVCNRSLACSCPSSRMISSCVGASSPRRRCAICHSSCTVRRPSIAARINRAAGVKRCTRPEAGSCSRYHSSPRYRWR